MSQAATITKHGERHYTIQLLSTRGHTNSIGQILTAPDTVILGFRKDTDPPGVNLDPVDLLSVLHMELEGTAAAEHLEAAAEALTGASIAEVAEKPAGQVVPRLGEKKKPGRKPKADKPVAEEAA